MILDALCAVECRNISYVTFYDCAGGSLSSFFTVSSYHKAASSIYRRVATPCPGGVAFFVHCASPSFERGLRFFLEDSEIVGGLAAEGAAGADGASSKPSSSPTAAAAAASAASASLEIEMLDGGVEQFGLAVSKLLDISVLPGAIGGGATSLDANGEVDETCSRGVCHPTLSEFFEGLLR